MSKAKQGGGTFLGLILGMMLGLGIALGVAYYVSRLPNPFVAKNPSRLAGREAIDHNKDPNAALRSKAAPPPVQTASAGPSAAQEDDERLAERERERAIARERQQAEDERERRQAERERQQEERERAAEARQQQRQTSDDDPLGDLVAARSRAYDTRPGDAAGLFTYFVQVGAFRLHADAEAQRARLSLIGVQAAVSQREQSGRTIWRVRVGPFQNQDAAERVKARLASNDFEAALVRVQK